MANKTRADLRGEARRMLEDFPDVQITFGADASASANPITVSDGSKVNEGDKLEAGTEMMLVSAAPTGNSVPVSRGAHGTTATTHTSGDTILVEPHWYAIDYNRYINECLVSVLEEQKEDNYSLITNGKVITAFESGDTISGGSADTNKFLTGVQGRILTNQAVTITKAVNCGGVDTDNFDLEVYVPDTDDITQITLALKVDVNNYYSQDYTGFNKGWQRISFPRDSFTKTASPTWEAIASIVITVTGSRITLDNLRLRYANEIIYTYDLPSTFNKVNEVFIYDYSGKQRDVRVRGWDILKGTGQSGVDQIIFKDNFPHSRMIGLVGVKNFTELTDDTTANDLPTRADKLSLPSLWACYRLVSQKELPRSRYDKISVKDERAVRTGTQIRTGQYFLALFEDARKRCGLNSLFKRTITN